MITRFSLTPFKQRLPYALAVVVVILLGLATRKFTSFLPAFVVDHFGDGLWAVMVYLGNRFLFVQKSPLFAAVAALLFSFCIEFSQLYQTEWLNALRQTTFGALVLGRGFLAIDLVRYTIGIAVAFCIDTLLLSRKRDIL